MRAVKPLTGFFAVLLSTVVAADEATDAEFDARLQRIERMIDNQVLLNMVKRIEAIQSEVQQLRGENERLVHELNTFMAHQREQHLNIDHLLQAFPGETGVPSNAVNALTSGGESAGNAGDAQNQQATDLDALQLSPGIPTPSPVMVTTPDATISTATPDDIKRDYKNAFILLKQGKYDESIAAFGFFLQTYPNSEYAANAQYWLAEASYVSRRYPQALAEFLKVINNYPTSSKLADAKLKLGFTRYELGQYEEARIELTQVRAQFPNSSVANLAQQRLERMLREGH